MNKNLKIKVRQNCLFCDYGIFLGRKMLFVSPSRLFWVKQKTATKHAKEVAKETGIPYDPEIIKQHGC